MGRRDPVLPAKAVILKVLEQESDTRKMSKPQYKELLDLLIEEFHLRLSIVKTELKEEG